MRAIVYTKYGPPEVLQIKEVEKPTVKDNEVLIRVYSTTVTAADSLMRRGDTFISRIFLGLRKPRRKILGTELAGEIESVGKAVKRFKKGDQIYGFTGFGLGAYAEYNTMNENGSLVIKPANISYEEAAASVDGASTALFFLREKANIDFSLAATDGCCSTINPRQKILILGASGSIGTFAVQLARYSGAEVTGVCSTANIELVKSLGADKVIDYTKEDFIKNGETYDIIFDTVGKSSFSSCKDKLKKKGLYLLTTGGLIHYVLMLWTSMISGKKILCGMSIEKTEALIFIRELIEAGKMKPVIDRRYPLEQIADAHRYVDRGHKKGSVVITVEHNNKPSNPMHCH